MWEGMGRRSGWRRIWDEESLGVERFKCFLVLVGRRDIFFIFRGGNEREGCSCGDICRFG